MKTGSFFIKIRFFSENSMSKGLCFISFEFASCIFNKNIALIM